MKYFVVSDIHSFYNELIRALSNTGYDPANPEHKLIICGDLFDRGPNSFATFKFIAPLVNSGKAIFVRGNHEDLLEDLVYRGYPHDIDGHDCNCTTDTVCQLATADETTCIDTLSMAFGDACEAVKPVLKWINEHSVPYVEIGRYIFVHCWIPTINCDGLPAYYTHDRVYKFNPNWRKADMHDWKDATWGNPCNMYGKGLYEPNKTIVCGHWHASAFHNRFEKHIGPENDFDAEADFSTFRSDDNAVVAIDACTAWTGKVNVLVINDTDKVPTDPVNMSEGTKGAIYARLH